MEDPISRSLKKVIEDSDLCKTFAQMQDEEEVYRFLSQMDETITKEKFNEWLEDNMKNKYKLDLLSGNELKKIAGGKGKDISKKAISAALATLVLGSPGASAGNKTKSFNPIQNSTSSVYKKLFIASAAAAIGVPTAGLGVYMLQKVARENFSKNRNSPALQGLGKNGNSGSSGEITGGIAGGYTSNYEEAPFSGIWNLGNTCFANGIFQCLHSIPNLRENLEPKKLNAAIDAQKAKLRELEKQIQKVKSEIEQPLMDLQQTLRKYEERCLSEKDLEEMPVGGTILKKDPLKSVIDLDYENEKLIDIKNKIAQFNDCLNRPNFQPILNAYNFSANDRHLINYAIVQINGRTGQVEQILNQQLKLKLEDNEKAQTKYKFLHKVLAEMDKNNSNIPEAQNLIDAVFPNLQGDQADAEAFLRGLNLPDSILNIKLLENLYTDSFEDDLNPRITGKEDAFLVRIGYEFGHEHEHALNILPELTQGENKFKLVCVAMHEGTQNGGHYYAYRKHTDGSWWKCNDGSVTKECNNDAELLNIDYVKKHATLLTYVKEQ